MKHKRLLIRAAALAAVGAFAVHACGPAAHAQEATPAEQPPAAAPAASAPESPAPAAPVAPVAPAPAADETIEPILPPLATQPGREGALSTQPSVTVTAFRFEGNDRVPADELQKVVAPYLNRPLTIEDLEAARVDLTRYLINKGYINSGAVLPDQTVEGGVVTYQIVEGRLTEINVSGNQYLRDRYIVSRLERAGRAPLDILRLKDQLELLRQDPNVRSIQAELRPGTAPGESALDVAVNDVQPLQLGVQYSNRRPPSVGSTAVDILFVDRNVTGWGDQLSVRYDLANGRPQELELAGAEDFSVDYSIPVTPADTVVSLSFSRTDSVVRESPFEDLDINSRSNSYALTVRQPVFRRPTFEPATDTTPAKAATEIAVFGSLAYRQNETFLLGRRFEFSPGTDDGKSRVWAVRVGQELTRRTQEDALSFRSTFSFGLPIFDATKNGQFTFGTETAEEVRGEDLPDSQFVTWLGQVQYVRRLGPAFDFGRVDLSSWQVVLKGAAQLSNSPLLSTEQFAVGGFDTVRGYRENFLVRDQGASGSVELRVPVIQTRAGEDVLTVVPFFDIGFAQDLTGAFDDTTLASVGVGLVYAPDPRVLAQLYYGYALLNKTDEHPDLQDVGLHFSVTVYAF